MATVRYRKIHSRLVVFAFAVGLQVTRTGMLYRSQFDIVVGAVYMRRDLQRQYMSQNVRRLVVG